MKSAPPLIPASSAGSTATAEASVARQGTCNTATGREINRLLAAAAVESASGVPANRPVHVYLQVASACNLDCFMCYEHLRPEGQRHGKGLKSLDPEIWRRLELEVLPWATHLTFGVGGEPTIADRFVEYAHRAADMGLELHLVTNGSKLTVPAVADVIGRRFASVQISLDAATARTHNSIRKGSNWDRMVTGLEMLAEARARRDPGSPLKATLCMVLMRRNVDELEALLEFAKRLGFDGVHAQHVIPITQEASDEQLCDEPTRWDAVRSRCMQRARELGVELDAPAPFGDKPPTVVVAAKKGCEARAAGRPIPCSLPIVSVNILVDGSIAPCCHPVAHRRMLFGNVLERPFAEAWHGVAATHLRRSLRSGAAPEVCRSCSVVGGDGEAREDHEALSSEWSLAEEAQLAAKTAAPPRLDVAEFEASGANRVLDELLAERKALRAERDGLLSHAATLEQENVALKEHAKTLGRENSALKGHAKAIDLENSALKEHAKVIDLENSALKGHAKAIDLENNALKGHAKAIDLENSALKGHLETLDRENKALKGHAKSLDRMVEELRAEQSSLHVHLRRLASHIDAVEAGHAAAMLQLARYAGPGGRLRMLARVIGLPRISRAKEGKS
jgi:radical SAM protein with 4Fe4S-binding SPASM domain